MPSPLSGLTQAAASPISAQLGPATLRHRAAHRQQRRRGHPELAGELELVAAQLGVVRHQRLDAEVGGALAGGEGADADVHLAGAQREDPAVAGQHLPRLVAQLEVAADPRVVAHARSRRRTGRRRRRRCRGATRGPSTLPSGERTPSATTRWRQPISTRPVVGLEHHAGDPVALAAYVDRAGAVDRGRPGLDARWCAGGRRARCGPPRSPTTAGCRPARAAAGSGRSRAPGAPG